MQFKQIDCKMKEVYYTPVPIEEKTETTKAGYDFWNFMNIIAIQNKAVIQRRQFA